METIALSQPKTTQLRADWSARILRMTAALLLAVLMPAHAGAASYIPDPSYGTGLISPDAFAGSFSRNYVGRNLVRLDNGDIVVAGLVPKFEGGTNLVNVGLVRYNASGTRVAWSNPTALYAFYGNQYLIYPNRDDATANNDLRIDDVKDMKLFGDRIFVLVDSYFQNFAGPYVKRSRVLVFKTDGQFLAAAAVGPADTFAGGIALYDNGAFPTVVSLVYAGYTRPESGPSRPVFARYTVAANGAMDEQVQATPNPANFCPADRACEIHGVALGGSFAGPPRVYLAGTRYQNGTANWDFLAMALNTNGTPITSFGHDGVNTVQFNVGGNLLDRANAIVVDRGGFASEDQIYLIGDVAQGCKQGAGVAKLTQDGELDNSFGAPVFLGGLSGKRVVGGSNSSPCLLNLVETSAVAGALVDDRLAVAGYQAAPCFSIGGAGCEDDVNGMAIVLGADTGDVGNVLSFERYPYTDTVGGSRTRHSGFAGVAASGDGTFTVAGFARYFQSAPGAPEGAFQYATLRIKPTVEIFSDGFEPD